MAKKEKANGMAILNEQINKKEFSRVYLLGGTEPYLIYQYRDKLIAAMINPNDTMNFITYKGENSKPEDIIEFADTMPFFTERRVVLVENSNFFKNGCEKLEEALDGLPDTTVLIFVEKNIDNRKKLSKLVAQLGTVAMFDAPDSEMLAVWLNGMFVKDQIAISGATLRYLIDRVGTSQARQGMYPALYRAAVRGSYRHRAVRHRCDAGGSGALRAAPGPLRGGDLLRRGAAAHCLSGAERNGGRLLMGQFDHVVVVGYGRSAVAKSGKKGALRNMHPVIKVVPAGLGPEAVQALFQIVNVGKAPPGLRPCRMGAGQVPAGGRQGHL